MKLTFCYRLVALAALAGSMLSAKAQGFLSSGLVAYYPLAGNANEATGKNDNGTISGATLTTDRFSRPGMAYEFNGSNSFITAVVTNLPTGSASRTVSLWAKPKPIIPFQGTYLLFWGTNQNTRGFGPLNIGIPYTWQAGGWGGGNGINTDVQVDTNWHHVVVSYDGTAMSMWLDGSHYVHASTTINTPLSKLTIGAGPDQEFFSGAISNVRIYKRSFSPQEVSALYEYESSPYPIASLLKAVKPVFSNLSVGTNYQLQTSSDFISWTNQGSPFTATNFMITYPQYWDMDIGEQLFFRLKASP